MNAELAGQLFFAFAVVTVMMFVFVKYGGPTAALFGARIHRTIGEVDACSGRTWSIKIKVHALAGGSPDKAIGLQVISKGLGSYESSAIVLSASGAKQLAVLIESRV